MTTAFLAVVQSQWASFEYQSDVLVRATRTSGAGRGNAENAPAFSEGAPRWRQPRGPVPKYCLHASLGDFAPFDIKIPSGAGSVGSIADIRSAMRAAPERAERVRARWASRLTARLLLQAACDARCRHLRARTIRSRARGGVDVVAELADASRCGLAVVASTGQCESADGRYRGPHAAAYVGSIAARRALGELARPGPALGRAGVN